MIVNERITSYINSLEYPESSLCAAIKKEAIKNEVPIIRNETASLLKFLIKLTHPKKILEVGTAVGYSALLMAECMDSNCTITTIEKYDKRIIEAKENFKNSNMSNRITLLEGDALDILKKLEGEYDFIFMDAAKGQYINFFPEVMRLLEKNGILISDNVLQDGDIIESRFAVTRRNRTIHSRMRDYLYTLKHTNELTTAIIPIGDGVAVTTKDSARQ